MAQPVPLLVGAGGSPVYSANYGAANRNQWSSGLMDCFTDFPLCIKGWLCLPCLMQQNSAALDGDEPLCGGFCCYPANIFKNRLQSKSVFGIEYNCFADCLTPWCCGPCSECQIAREIKHFRETQEAQNPAQLVYTGNGGSAIYVPKLHAPRNNSWSSGLGDCCDTPGLCCLACCRLPYFVAWNSYLLDGNFGCRVIGCSNAWKNRTQAQGLFGIPNEGFKDCMIAVCCGPCSEVQVHRHAAAVLQAKAAANLFMFSPEHVWFVPPPTQQVMIATYQPQQAAPAPYNPGNTAMAPTTDQQQTTTA